MSTRSGPVKSDVINLELPIRTSRLSLRAATVDDVDALHARRNEPKAAEFQSWAMPYSRQQAEQLIDGLVTMSGPTLGEWWMLMVDTVNEAGASVDTVGDVAVHLDESGTIVEIGYSFASDHWGNGYASEAVDAVITNLFERHDELIRVQAQMHPDNYASAGVVERSGLVYEGRTKLSFVPPMGEGGPTQDRSDDLIYGVVREDWEAWQNRPAESPSELKLVELSNGNLEMVENIAIHKSQERLVAPVLVSVAQVLLPPPRAGVTGWGRVVEADGEVVGLVTMVMGDDPTRYPYLWRLSIDRRHQRRGIGRMLLDLLVSQVRDWGAETLRVSWMPGSGSPEPFYLKYGFVPTGVVDEHGEIEALLTI